MSSTNFTIEGSGYDADGRAVASDTRDPRFEPTIREIYLLSNVLTTVLQRRKYRNRGRPGMANFKQILA